MPKLTEKQKLFVKEYLVDLNATQAAIRAGYSKNNADKIGSELLGKTRVQEVIQEELKKRAEKVEIDAEYVLKGLKDITSNKEEKTSDRLKAFELLGKYLKLFTDKVEHEGTVQIKLEGEVQKWAK